MIDKEILKKLENPPKKTINLVVKLNPKYMNFVYMVVDGHGRIGLPRTRNGKEGILDIITSPDYINDLYKILDDIKENYDESLEISGELGDDWIKAVK
jgi:hypothetical protein